MTAIVWKRYGSSKSHHAAHAFRDGVQLCGIRHGRTGFQYDPSRHPVPRVVDLSPHGVPYGPTCKRCLKLFHRSRGVAT